MQVGVGLFFTGMVHVYMIIAMNHVITMRFSINCPTVICSPVVYYVFKREASSETYGPRVSFLLYCISFIIASRLLFCNLYFPVYTRKYQKIFILLCLSDLTFVSDHEGIDNPFIALVARLLIVCSSTRRLVRCLLLD